MENFNTKENWDKTLINLQEDITWKTRRADWKTITKDSILIDEIEETIHKYKPDVKTLLEIGPGDGYVVYGLTRGDFVNMTIDVVDISEVSLKMINSHSPVVTTYQGEMEKFELCKKYDVILAAQVLEHTVNINKTIAQIKKHLKYMGIFIAILPYKWGIDKQHNINIDDMFIDRLEQSIGKIEHNSESVQYQSRIVVVRNYAI